jgi:NAD(P)H-hydrate epimerase
MKIVTSSQMRQAEEECAGIGIPTDILMENAGKAVAGEVRRVLGGLSGQNVLILIGPGNNGGDGLVCARYLYGWGARVSLWMATERADDPNLGMIRERSITCILATEDDSLERFETSLLEAGVVIDALFGTGKVRPLEGPIADILGRVAQAEKERPALRIVAVDLPSGLDADTGAVDEVCLYADNTITLAFPKPGLFNLPGAERVGEVTVADIGIPEDLVPPTSAGLITETWAREMLPARPLVANKGSFGRVLVVAGSINYVGAAYLASSGAVRVGAGLVTLATPRSLQPILAAKLAEVTYLPLPETGEGTVAAPAIKQITPYLENYRVLLIGCGLGKNQSVKLLVKSLLLRGEDRLPSLVLDADALNALSDVPKWWREFTQEAILTPHPGEMARLAGASVDEIQKDRIDICRGLASEWHKVIVLKGAYTVVAGPDGQAQVSPVANPGLASAGTGDVLAGVIAGLVAQGLPLFEAACLGVHLHGAAGEMVKSELGDAGMTASDLLAVLPKTLKRLKGK